MNAICASWCKRLVSLCLLAGAALLTAGCSQPSKVQALNDASAFDEQVLAAPEPVLMFFYKEGCASCAALEPTIDQLSNEYFGRVKFMKYPLMSFVFVPNSAPLRDRYNVTLYPTVVLFVGGQERKRWVADYAINDYRKELDLVAGPKAK